TPIAACVAGAFAKPGVGCELHSPQDPKLSRPEKRGASRKTVRGQMVRLSEPYLHRNYLIYIDATNK
ncbi:MAG TPA: hypothetical protein VIP31_08095, partial [Acidovorax sp.]